MTHGYLEADAEDFRLAVLAACDRYSLMVGTASLKRSRVDDVDREWFGITTAFDEFNGRLLEPYRLLAPK
jgi:hypothetical protein